MINRSISTVIPAEDFLGGKTEKLFVKFGSNVSDFKGVLSLDYSAGMAAISMNKLTLKEMNDIAKVSAFLINI